ncbi:thioredoxin-disulfide reductase [Thermoleophilum album]|uniref:Thioredoxin reductase n=1 Tax=Thermoleophilum album TaxID=29539 RepID=A0A1H6FVL5_THEAL|nr:thioredoxin-disulfide reductase [Thermoleophilum album]SEH13835.1 thioredoxin reductase (NADPH) [Thermoleophilum album]
MSETHEYRDLENVVIIGSGPAGYTAAIYAARADLQPLCVEGFQWGGLLQLTTDVENYPGYPDGVQGPQMMADFRRQAERFGTRFLSEDATALRLSRETGVPHLVEVGERSIRARAVIVATGTEPKKLGVPGEDEFAARGVSYCATCDAAFFRGRDTIVVGGGDTAMEDATFLAKFARKVTIVHRRREFRASAIMVDRARATENIEFLTPYVVERFEGSEALERVVLRNREDGSELVLEAQGAFIAIGHRPRSELVADQLRLDEQGYVIVEDRSTRTGVPGVFACGDLIDPVYRQAVTAAGSGCMAALDCEAYLRDTAPELARMKAAVARG